MIAGYNFFGLEEGAIFDTPICTEMIDELTMDKGIYDEVYVDLNTAVTDTKLKPTEWTIHTIMDAKFTGDLDGGSLGAEGFKITHIQLYRSLYGIEKWDLIAQFEYNEDFNVYDYVDRYVQSGMTYRYAVVPVANEILGEKLLSDTVSVYYEGIFLTDKKENRRLDYDIELGDIGYVTASSVNNPLNGEYPVVVVGNTNYRSGTLATLPLSESTIKMAGAGIDKSAEQVNRDKWIAFINNRKAKVLRMDSGVLMLIFTQNPKIAHKTNDLIRDLAKISFDYIEIGGLTFDMMVNNDLISNANLSNFTYSDDGTVIVE
ncbi:hypothetical protein [Peribacillus asahii]|uniref:hypothetical protein n=1 Tax=Peribacillus asahii TaxID=228899 RepID=UPI00380D3283